MDKYEPIELRLEIDPYALKTLRAVAAEVGGEEAILAKSLVERWGMIAAMPDGEDSAGRQRLRLATPDELTDRALECTERLFAKMRARGWYFDVPLPLQEVEKETG